jgi:hypothetical protein
LRRDDFVRQEFKPCNSMKKYIQNLLVVLALFGGVHRAFAPVVPGSLQVTILPAGAVTAGAKWQMDGGPVQNSGATISVNQGFHTVTFTPISGWTSPASEQVTITINQTTTTNGTYVPIPTLTVTLTTTNTAMVSWPSPSTGWNLQQNTNLATTNWVASPETVNDDGTNKYIIVNLPTGNLFFRLKQP